MLKMFIENLIGDVLISFRKLKNSYLRNTAQNFMNLMVAVELQ